MPNTLGLLPLFHPETMNVNGAFCRASSFAFEGNRAIQKALLQIQAERLRVNRALLMFIPLIWPPLVIVLAKGLVGWELYRAPGPVWLLWNVLFGLSMIPVGVWLSRRFEKHLMGRELADALSALNSLNRFAE